MPSRDLSITAPAEKKDLIVETIQTEFKVLPVRELDHKTVKRFDEPAPTRFVELGYLGVPDSFMERARALGARMISKWDPSLLSQSGA